MNIGSSNIISFNEVWKSISVMKETNIDAVLKDNLEANFCRFDVSKIASNIESFFVDLSFSIQNLKSRIILKSK